MVLVFQIVAALILFSLLPFILFVAFKLTFLPWDFVKWMNRERPIDPRVAANILRDGKPVHWLVRDREWSEIPAWIRERFSRSNYAGWIYWVRLRLYYYSKGRIKFPHSTRKTAL